MYWRTHAVAHGMHGSKHARWNMNEKRAIEIATLIVQLISLGPPAP